MISKWANKKSEAIILRRKGESIKYIEKALSIPRSTLSGWLRSVPLTKKQKSVLEKKKLQGLSRARTAAILWHNAQKNNRLREVARVSSGVLEAIPDNLMILELALAFLYLGEGAKTRDRASLGSSDARILKFFIYCLRRIYHLPIKKIRCYLHLRADQNDIKMKHYWHKELGLPLTNFGKSSFDKRTVGIATYPQYKGVCLIECGRVEIQRRLLYIATGFCKKTLEGFEAYMRA